MLTILEGSTFCLSDDLGDVSGETSGFFAWDTRFLSRLVLRVDGASPLPLSAGRLKHFAAAFYLRNPRVAGLPSDSLSIARNRFVGTGLQERIAVQNESMDRLAFELSLELGTDFADIISVKLHDFAFGDPEHAPCFPLRCSQGRSRRTARSSSRSRTAMRRPGSSSLARDASSTGNSFFRSSWIRTRVGSCGSTSSPRLGAYLSRPSRPSSDSTTSSRSWATSSRRGRSAFPSCAAAGRESLRRAFDQSVSDIAALRIRSGVERRPLFAAGMPWFMTVFGRDTAITSLADAPFFDGSRLGRARRPRPAAGDGRRPLDRRRAGKDRPRGAARSRGGDVVRPLLRLGRLDAALPRSPGRDVSLDGRHGARHEAP